MNPKYITLSFIGMCAVSGVFGGFVAVGLTFLGASDFISGLVSGITLMALLSSFLRD